MKRKRRGGRQRERGGKGEEGDRNGGSRKEKGGEGRKGGGREIVKPGAPKVDSPPRAVLSVIMSSVYSIAFPRTCSLCRY